MAFTSLPEQPDSAYASASTPKAVSLEAVFTGANGFNTIRLFAATAVLFSHAFALTGFAEPLSTLPSGTTLGTLSVAVFFIVSGFLISMSFERGLLTSFIEKRARRIMPALIVAVTLSTLLLGLIWTTLPPATYLASAGTWKYLINFLFLPAPLTLPGVFENNLSSAVNGSLWTLKFEVACYGLVVLALVTKRLRVPLVITLWLGSFVVARLLPENSEGALFYIERLAFLFRFFGTGMLLYLFRSSIPMHKGWAVAAFVLLTGSAFTPIFPEIAATAGAYWLMFFAYYCPVWFRDITKNGDLSYGVYVYAFPIQQIFVPLSLGTAIPWLTNIALSLPLTMLAGLLSWKLVEKPMIRRR